MSNKYEDTFNVLCHRYAFFLRENYGKRSKATVFEIYKMLFNSIREGTKSSVDYSVFDSWLQAYSKNKVDSWIVSEASRIGLEAALLKRYSDAWLDSLRSYVSDSRLHGVVVWRFVKPERSTLGYTVWDVTDETGFGYPTLNIHAKGGDTPDQQGNRFVWLLTVLPECLLDCVEYPLGGSGKSSGLNFTVNDAMKHSDLFDSHWMYEKGTDNWVGLEMLLKLKKQIPDMTGMPVLSLRIEGLLKVWTEIVDTALSKSL